MNGHHSISRCYLHVNFDTADITADADIDLVVTPTYLNATSKWVTVSWKNVPKPSKDDWIGLWVLQDSATIFPDKHAPIKYQVESICACAVYNLARPGM